MIRALTLCFAFLSGGKGLAADCSKWTDGDNFFWDVTPEEVERCLQSGRSMHETDDIDGTPLHYAVKWANPDVIRVLLDHGAPLEARNTHGATPLHVAILRTRHAEIVDILLDAGADIETRDNAGESLLSSSTQFNGRPELTTRLIERGADPNADLGGGMTALHFAERSNRPDSVRLLLEGGADPDPVTTSGRTPLLNAARYTWKPEILTLLVNAGARTDRTLPDGTTILELFEANQDLKRLLDRNHLDALRRLLSQP